MAYHNPQNLWVVFHPLYTIYPKQAGVLFFSLFIWKKHMLEIFSWLSEQMCWRDRPDKHLNRGDFFMCMCETKITIKNQPLPCFKPPFFFPKFMF